MTLQKQTIPLVLGLGVNTKVDPKAMAGQLLRMENCTMTRTGEIRKRNGYTGLSTSVLGGQQELTSGLKATSFNNELLLVDQRSLFSYGAESAVWANKGPCPTTSLSTAPVLANSYAQSSADLAYSRNTTTYAWEDSRGGVRAMVVDQTSGNRLITDTELHATATRPRCFAVGQYHFVFYIVSGSLYCRRIDVANPTRFGSANLISAAVKSATPHFDVCLVGTSRMLVGYRNSSDQLELAYVSLDGTVAGLPQGVPPPTAFAAIDPDTSLTLISGERELQKDVIHVAWYDSATGVKVFSVFNDFTTAHAETTLSADTALDVRNITGVAYVSSITGESRLDLFWERDAAADINHYIERSNISVSTFSASPVVVFQRAAGLASKAYRVGNATRVTASYASAEGLQDTLFSLSDASQLFAEGWGYNWGFSWGGYGTVGNRSVIQAKILSTVAGGHTARDSNLPGIWSLRDSTVLLAAGRKTRVVADNVTTFTLLGINQAVLNHAAESIGQPVQLGQNLHIPGGFLKMYDGDSVVEHGFHLYPESVTTAQASGGSITDGTYQHVVVWEWVDAKGQIHRSAPSLPESVTVTGGPKKVEVTIPTLRYTSKTAPARSEVIASVYRTTAGGSLFYKVSSDASPLYNDPTADTISFDDTLVDADIISKPLLYTTGGTLENTAVSACDVAVAYKNRLFAAGLEQESDLRYSKEFVRDEGVAFSEALTVSANSGSGGVKALAVLDEKLVIFKEGQIFVLVGDGPTDTGAQNDFGTPQQVSSDVGCTEPESVVLTPAGIMFKSAKGIYLLDRALNVSYVGAEVQEFNSLNVSSAILVPDVNQVRFTTTAGTTLVYDYYFKSWGIYTNQAAVSATNWQGSYLWLNTVGKMFQEAVGSYSDDGQPIRSLIETSWVSIGGLQGFQRFYRLQLLGGYVGNHTLRATLSYDFEPFSRESFSIVPATAPDAAVVGQTYGESSPYGSEATYGTGTGVYQWEVRPARQKSQSFKLTLEDLFPDGDSTGGFTLSGITMVIGVKGGLRRLGDGHVMQG